MKLLEYEAKQLLNRYGIPIPKGAVLQSEGELPELPSVIKSQVPVGGRGKAGGIRIVHSDDEAKLAFAEVLDLEISGYKPQVLLAEELVDIERELYLSLVVNRETASVEIVAHNEGGVEVESQDSDSFLRLVVDSSSHVVGSSSPDGEQNIEDSRWKMEDEGSPDGEWDIIGGQLAEHYDLPGQTFALQDMIENLYKCFVEQDATLLEINPLALTKSNKLVAADCKLELDDMAAFRHPDWTFEDTVADANFVTLDTHGTVATIANGAGLAMATVDAVVAAGLRPANFLDIGGGATTENVVASFRQIMQIPSVDSIVINIFGGIVQCDTVARAIIEAREAIDDLPKLYIRLSGTNADIAADLLAEHDIKLYPTLRDCLEAIA